MPTAPRIDTVVLGSDAPRLDPSNSDGATNLLSRLKTNNQALDNLRRALEGDESRHEPRESKSAKSA